MIGIRKVEITSGYQVPNLWLVGPNRLYYVLLASSVVGCIRVFVIKEGTNVSHMVSHTIC